MIANGENGKPQISQEKKLLVEFFFSPNKNYYQRTRAS